MAATSTTIAVQHLLDQLAVASPTADDALVRAVLARSVDRLHALCGRLLHGRYPRLTRPPAHLDANDLLGALAARLLRSLEQVKPRSVRQFFALAHQHVRWELNDLARRVDLFPPQQAIVAEPHDPQPPTSASDAATLQRILAAIEALPVDEREVFELVRMQGLTHPEAAALLQVAEKTIQRRLRRGLLLLTESLHELVAGDELDAGEPGPAPGAGNAPAAAAPRGER